LHEELKEIYVPNQEVKDDGGGWSETGEKTQIKFNNHELLVNIENSIIRDIFGGIMRNEFHVDGSRQSSITFDPSFVLSLDIPNDYRDDITIEECLDNYFQKVNVEGYQQNGKTVRAHQRYLFEKLPNILMVNLKRFVYHG
jgi:ubiquitin C-terminal hydrolase